MINALSEGTAYALPLLSTWKCRKYLCGFCLTFRFRESCAARDARFPWRPAVAPARCRPRYTAHAPYGPCAMRPMRHAAHMRLVTSHARLKTPSLFNCFRRWCCHSAPLCFRLYESESKKRTVNTAETVVLLNRDWETPFISYQQTILNPRKYLQNFESFREIWVFWDESTTLKTLKS